MIVAGGTDSPVGRLIDEGGWTGFQTIIVGIAALAFFAEGMASQSMGLAMPALTRAWGLPASAFSSATAIGLVGFAIGALAGGMIGDRIGRRPLLIGALVVLAVGTVGCAFAATMGELMLARIVQGLGLGGSLPAATAIAAEFTPTRRRALALAITVAFLPIGGLIAGETAAAMVPVRGYRAIFAVSAAVTIATALVAALVLPESPRFLATRLAGRAALARVMARLGHDVADMPVTTPAGERRSEGAGILDPAHRRDTLLLWLAFFGVVLAMYSQFSWIPTMLSRRHLPIASVSRGISSLSAGGIVGGLISGWMTQRFGSRACFAVLTFGTVAAAVALSLTVTMPAVPALPLAAGLALLGACTSGSQTALYSVGANVYPAATRSSGIGVSIAWGRVGAVLSSYTGILSVDLGGPPAFFGIIAAACVVALVAILGISRTVRGARVATG